MQLNQDGTVTVTPRPLSVVCAGARRAACGQCQAPPSIPCVLGSHGTTGDHVARFAAACACHTDGFNAARARMSRARGEPGGTQMTGAAPSASQLVIASGVRLAGGSCAAPASSAGTIAFWAIHDKPHTICGRLALAQPLLPGDAQGMDLRPQAPEIPSADEVPIDDLLAGVRTTAELNELIREGLAAARRGGQDLPGVHP